MFWDKKCKNCNVKIDKNWAFCPSCGYQLRGGKAKDMFQEFDKEFKQIDKMMEMKAPQVVFPPMKGKGISITITSDNVSPPKIDVQPFGGHKHLHHHVEQRPSRIPKTMEEPETKMQNIKNRQIITLNLPDVKSLEDIEIKQLDQSIEIKAFAGDKAYFKLLPIPSNAVVNNEFKDGVLKIEVMR